VSARPSPHSGRATAIRSAKRGGASAATIAFVLAVGLAAGALFVIGWTSGLFPWPPAPEFGARTQQPPVESKPEPLPVPSASEVSLARANGWYRNGRLHDAIRPGDPLRARADELRAAIQQKLLEAARVSEPR